ncbi:uncharacterized protein LOC104888269 isoform X1 [Beta vulgaris subsp. vulgaris]|uniref:uncharacterized protein LOC104888269 isoform X1 n=1 Tax=Beta vulgaris subsp. vulgaris TaxID=3555 RepID=UPI00203705C8|nr:uncharacterized protein LOC104888269 isoform X1 [Beta vulgaris subsp. vulgaris]
MVKNDGKLKSAMRRKPLQDLSNGGVKSTKMNKMKFKQQQQQQLPHSQIQHPNNEDPLDRLLLLHSDISSLLHHIDELVVQAVKVDTTETEKINEIKSFTTLLSDMHSSLQPWVPRLQKALAVPHPESEAQYYETCIVSSCVLDQGDSHAVDTPKPTKDEHLVSPSPLVSWRATNYGEERGKQLFLLTPLLGPKTIMSKSHALTKLTTYEGISSSPAATFPSLGADDKSNNENLKVVSNNMESMSDIPVSDLSTTLFTPCHRNPPLRTDVPHELGHETSHRKIVKFHKSTPFPVVNKSICQSDSESTSGEGLEKLGLKYPELIGMTRSCKSNNRCTSLEASPAWKTSPPKCCTLLEPLDEKHPQDDASLQELASTFTQQLCLASKESNITNNNQDKKSKQFSLRANIGSSFATVDSTPLWKGSESAIHKGKRPGENTLKRELWTRFEAATTNECHLNFSGLNDTSHRGFLERLEEASCDESVHTDVDT